MFPRNTHLLGDSAYALSSWLLTSFKDTEQRRYNYVHSCTRNPVERAFGSLKGRFNRLEVY
ncbi:hypothetical protein KUTeg_011745 [Tegillarca granosa]|uniref:DDE Tnp4 domain-containing protein n=1 Tax=Tegillarca granosa TaxID=220873 RepID=A0ABQ9F164_TEGGR|nr:hypothetical protein KUTeg_011745 [Tegillarca granosa]